MITLIPSQETRKTSILLRVLLSSALILQYFPAAPQAHAAAILQENFPEDVSAIQLPADLGKIEESFKGTDPRLVILVQDAHAIPDAQRSIQKIIEHFQNTNGLKLVAAEGASGPFDTQIFRSFPDKKLLKKAFEDYLEKGELTGSMAAAVFNSAPTIYYGVEDWNAYEDGLRFFLAAMSREEKLMGVLAERKAALEAKKDAAYSKELREIDRMLGEFLENKRDILSVLKALAAVQAPQENTELAILLNEAQRAKQSDTHSNWEDELNQQARKAEKELNGRPANAENRAAGLEFNSKMQEYHTSAITPEAFALFLKEFSEKQKLSFVFSKDFSSKAADQRRMRDLEGTQFFKDLENYAANVKKSLLVNDEQRQMDKETHRLQLLERFVRLEIGFDEWREIQQINTAGHGLDLNTQFDFYQNAEKRDKAFFERLQPLFEREQARAAVMIAGGFHAEGLTHTFRENNISFIRIMPAIQSVSEKSSYRAHMRGDVSWKEFFTVENGKVSPYKAFVRGTREKLFKMLKDNVGPALRDWRDQIIRDLALENKVGDAGKYTAFLDERAVNGEADVPRFERIEKFIEQLRMLETQGSLDRDHVLKLLTPASAIPDTSSSVPNPDVWVDAVLLPEAPQLERISAVDDELQLAMSEMRTEVARAEVRNLSQVFAATIELLQNIDTASAVTLERLRASVAVAEERERRTNTTRGRLSIAVIEFVSAYLARDSEKARAAIRKFDADADAIPDIAPQILSIMESHLNALQTPPARPAGSPDRILIEGLQASIVILLAIESGQPIDLEQLKQIRSYVENAEAALGRPQQTTRGNLTRSIHDFIIAGASQNLDEAQAALARFERNADQLGSTGTQVLQLMRRLTSLMTAEPLNPDNKLTRALMLAMSYLRAIASEGQDANFLILERIELEVQKAERRLGRTNTARGLLTRAILGFMEAVRVNDQRNAREYRNSFAKFATAVPFGRETLANMDQIIGEMQNADIVSPDEKLTGALEIAFALLGNFTGPASKIDPKVLQRLSDEVRSAEIALGREGKTGRGTVIKALLAFMEAVQNKQWAQARQLIQTIDGLLPGMNLTAMFSWIVNAAEEGVSDTVVDRDQPVETVVTSTSKRIIRDIAARIADNEDVNIAYVCTANKNRSAAAHLLTQQAFSEQPNVTVSSAGLISAQLGFDKQPLSRVNPTLQAELQKRGVSESVVDSFRSAQLTPEFVENADIIVAAGEKHRSLIEANFPAAKGKVVLFTEMHPDLDKYGSEMPDPEAGDIEMPDLVDLIQGKIIPAFIARAEIRAVSERAKYLSELSPEEIARRTVDNLDFEYPKRDNTVVKLVRYFTNLDSFGYAVSDELLRVANAKIQNNTIFTGFEPGHLADEFRAYQPEQIGNMAFRMAEILDTAVLERPANERRWFYITVVRALNEAMRNIELMPKASATSARVDISSFLKNGAVFNGPIIELTNQQIGDLADSGQDIYLVTLDGNAFQVGKQPAHLMGLPAGFLISNFTGSQARPRALEAALLKIAGAARYYAPWLFRAKNESTIFSEEPKKRSDVRVDQLRDAANLVLADLKPELAGDLIDPEIPGFEFDAAGNLVRAKFRPQLDSIKTQGIQVEVNPLRSELQQAQGAVRNMAAYLREKAAVFKNYPEAADMTKNLNETAARLEALIRSALFEDPLLDIMRNLRILGRGRATSTPQDSSLDLYEDPMRNIMLEHERFRYKYSPNTWYLGLQQAAVQSFAMLAGLIWRRKDGPDARSDVRVDQLKTAANLALADLKPELAGDLIDPEVRGFETDAAGNQVRAKFQPQLESIKSRGLQFEVNPFLNELEQAQTAVRGLADYLRSKAQVYRRYPEAAVMIGNLNNVASALAALAPQSPDALYRGAGFERRSDVRVNEERVLDGLALFVEDNLAGMGFTGIEMGEGIVDVEDASDLPYPNGVNVAIFDAVQGLGEAAAYLADQQGSNVKNVNYILTFPAGGVAFGKNNPDRVYAKYGIMIIDGKIQRVRFTKPLPVHSMVYGGGNESDVRNRLDEMAVPLLNSPMALKIDDKASLSAISGEVGLPVPESVEISGALSIDEIEQRMRELGARYPGSDLVVKPKLGMQGMGVESFSQNDITNAAARHAQQFLDRGDTIIVQPRISNSIYKRDGKETDWILRVFTTWENGKPKIGGILVFYNPDGKGIVNFYRGGKALSLDDFYGELGYDAAAQEEFVASLQGTFDRAMPGIESYLDAQKGSASSYPHTGVVGWDMMQDANGVWYAIEANLGSVGALDDIEKRAPVEKKGEASAPIALHLKSIGENYRSGHADVEDEFGESLIADSADVIHNTAYIFRFAKDFETAEILERHALTLNAASPARARFSEVLASILSNQGRYSEAAEVLAGAYQNIAPLPKFLLQQAQALVAANDNLRAIEVLDQLEKLENVDADIKVEANGVRNAIARADVRIDPENDPIANVRALEAWYRNGNLPRALRLRALGVQTNAYRFRGDETKLELLARDVRILRAANTLADFIAEDGDSELVARSAIFLGAIMHVETARAPLHELIPSSFVEQIETFIGTLPVARAELRILDTQADGAEAIDPELYLSIWRFAAQRYKTQFEEAKESAKDPNETKRLLDLSIHADRNVKRWERRALHEGFFKDQLKLFDFRRFEEIFTQTLLFNGDLLTFNLENKEFITGAAQAGLKSLQRSVRGTPVFTLQDYAGYFSAQGRDPEKMSNVHQMIVLYLTVRQQVEALNRKPFADAATEQARQGNLQITKQNLENIIAVFETVQTSDISVVARPQVLNLVLAEARERLEIVNRHIARAEVRWNPFKKSEPTGIDVLSKAAINNYAELINFFFTGVDADVMRNPKFIQAVANKFAGLVQADIVKRNGVAVVYVRDEIEKLVIAAYLKVEGRVAVEIPYLANPKGIGVNQFSPRTTYVQYKLLQQLIAKAHGSFKDLIPYDIVTGAPQEVHPPRGEKISVDFATSVNEQKLAQSLTAAIEKFDQGFRLEEALSARSEVRESEPREEMARADVRTLKPLVMIASMLLFARPGSTESLAAAADVISAQPVQATAPQLRDAAIEVAIAQANEWATAIAAIDEPVIMEYTLTEEEIAQIKNSSVAMKELFNTARMIVNYNSNILVRIVFPKDLAAKMRRDIGGLSQKQTDSARLIFDENSLIVAAQSQNGRLDAAPTVSITRTPLSVKEGRGLATDKYQIDGQLVTYDADGSETMLANFLTAGVRLQAAKLSQDTADGLVEYDQNRFRIESPDFLMQMAILRDMMTHILSARSA